MRFRRHSFHLKYYNTAAMHMNTSIQDIIPVLYSLKKAIFFSSWLNQIIFFAC